MSDIKPKAEIDVEGASIGNDKVIISTDNAAEHSLTFAQVWKEHPRLILFSLYWGISAFGW